MDEGVQHALEHDSLIDITTRGRKTGQPHRIEMRFHNLEGNSYLTGRPPRPRDWYATLLAHPEFTFHLKQGVRADVPARATPMLDQDGRRAILAAIHRAKRPLIRLAEAKCDPLRNGVTSEENVYARRRMLLQVDLHGLVELVFVGAVNDKYPNYGHVGFVYFCHLSRHPLGLKRFSKGGNLYGFGCRTLPPLSFHDTPHYPACN